MLYIALKRKRGTGTEISERAEKMIAANTPCGLVFPPSFSPFDMNTQWQSSLPLVSFDHRIQSFGVAQPNGLSRCSSARIRPLPHHMCTFITTIKIEGPSL
jgi:hypothetical protein